ncbi:large ribosomal subunit protein eL29-like [Oryctolagus cuniculus]|uniref:large ribosomal subunit protein eL29-like n=1 Tax=Oryctolagus cuniculus TaxID=9986 RepID=UPI00048E148D|nr:60S ribosomal protein L29-like [Oryctolagus cuniculus]
MVKVKSHTTDNQSSEWHRNSIKKPCLQRQESLMAIDPIFLYAFSYKYNTQALKMMQVKPQGHECTCKCCQHCLHIQGAQAQHPQGYQLQAQLSCLHGPPSGSMLCLHRPRVAGSAGQRLWPNTQAQVQGPSSHYESSSSSGTQ